MLLVGSGLFLIPLTSSSGMANNVPVAETFLLVPVADFIDHDAFPQYTQPWHSSQQNALLSLWFPNLVAQ